jgi:uncharacterized protein
VLLPSGLTVIGSGSCAITIVTDASLNRFGQRVDQGSRGTLQRQAASRFSWLIGSIMMNTTLALKNYPGRGRGVYTTIPIQKGEIVEVSPVIPLSAADWKVIKTTTLDAYVFAWGKNGRSNAIPLGFGGLFNHSDEPNLSFWLNVREKSITFRANRDIAILEQLTIDYMWSKKDRIKYRIEARPESE